METPDIVPIVVTIEIGEERDTMEIDPRGKGPVSGPPDLVAGKGREMTRRLIAARALRLLEGDGWRGVGDRTVDGLGILCIAPLGGAYFIQDHDAICRSTNP